MRSRLAILVAVVIAAAAAVFEVGRFVSSGRGSLPTNPASYLGVYETGPPGTYQPVTDFAKVVGRQPNLVGYYSGWGNPSRLRSRRRSASTAQSRFCSGDPSLASVSVIAAGGYDRYLRTFADSVRDFGQPVVIGMGHEMNTPWYSWGYGHVSTSTFVAAWRHVVTLFRDEGANNVTWLWTLQADEPGTGPDRFLVAWREVRHLGRHRRLLQPLRDLLRYLRRDHCSGAGLYRPAGAAV